MKKKIHSLIYDKAFHTYPQTAVRILYFSGSTYSLEVFKSGPMRSNENDAHLSHYLPCPCTIKLHNTFTKHPSIFNLCYFPT